MIDVLKGMFHIEKTLIYGFSMGGYGVWRLTFLFPALFEGAIVGSGITHDPRSDEVAIVAYHGGVAEVVSRQEFDFLTDGKDKAEEDKGGK